MPLHSAQATTILPEDSTAAAAVEPRARYTQTGLGVQQRNVMHSHVMMSHTHSQWPTALQAPAIIGQHIAKPNSIIAK